MTGRPITGETEQGRVTLSFEGAKAIYEIDTNRDGRTDLRVEAQGEMIGGRVHGSLVTQQGSQLPEGGVNAYGMVMAQNGVRYAADGQLDAREVNEIISRARVLSTEPLPPARTFMSGR